MKDCLMGVASGMALLAWGVVLAVALYPLLKRSAGRLREAGRGKCVRSALALLAVGLCVAYGGSKPGKPEPTPEPALHAISYDLAGGVNDPDNPTSYREGGVSIALKDPVRAGYVFAGWEPAGVIPVGATSDFHFTALWRAEGPSDPVVDPVDPPSGPSDPVVGPTDPAEDATVSLRLWETVLADGNGGYVTTDGHEPPFAATASATFDGVVLDAENRAAGTIQVKSSKASATRDSKLKAKVQMLGRKAVSFTGTLAKDGTATLTTRNASDGELVLTFGSNGLNGTWGVYTVVGARNLFAAREAAATALDRWQGVYSVALETESATGSGAAFAAGWSALSVSVGTRGRVKVSGAMADGAKVSLSSQLLVGEKFCLVPVVAPLYSKKGGVGFCVVLAEGRDPAVVATSDWNAASSRTPFTATLAAEAPVARLGGALPSQLTVELPSLPAAVAGAPVFREALPQGMSVTLSGGRFTLPRATRVSLSDGVLAGAEDANPSGLKLTYAAKTGLVKGSFTVYAQEAGKLKKFKAAVAGGLIGSAGYGTLTVKGAGSWPFLLK